MHVIDISNPRFEEQMTVVENLLLQLELDQIPVIRVFNKVDLISPDLARVLCARYQASPVCALRGETLTELLAAIEKKIGVPSAFF